MKSVNMRKNLARYVPDLVRGNIECLLLFLIKENHETYGYELMREIEKRSEGYFRLKEGTVYPALHRLENDGLVSGEWRELPGGQLRRYYTITQQGEQALREKMGAWEGFTAAVGLVFRPRPLESDVT